MLRFILKFVKYAAIGLGLIILILIAWFVIAQARYKQLATNVEVYVAEEFDKLQFANEITELRYASNIGCHNDYKTGATRCGIRYTRYYVSDAIPVEEFKRIDSHVRELGWTDWGGKLTLDKIEQRFEKGLMTFGIYSLKEKYRLDMHVHFYSEKDKDAINDEIRMFVNEYVDKYPTIYRVSIDADMVNNKL